MSKNRGVERVRFYINMKTGKDRKTKREVKKRFSRGISFGDVVSAGFASIFNQAYYIGKNRKRKNKRYIAVSREQGPPEGAESL